MEPPQSPEAPAPASASPGRSAARWATALTAPEPLEVCFSGTPPPRPRPRPPRRPSRPSRLWQREPPRRNPAPLASLRAAAARSRRGPR
eukprot:8102844-Pyramimonas_sp.AAC.1